MPELKIYDLFISHAWNYNDEYYKLLDFFQNASNFKYRNYSVPEHDPLPMTKLEERLFNQIKPVNIVLILSGMYVPRSDWIQKEIDIAIELSKPIIGIKPWGQERIPTAVTSVAKDIVGWNTDNIVSAIRRHSL